MTVPASPFPQHATPSGLLSPQSSSFELPEGSLHRFTSTNQPVSQSVSTLSAEQRSSVVHLTLSTLLKTFSTFIAQNEWAVCEAHKEDGISWHKYRRCPGPVQSDKGTEG